jgi:uncharacterized protein YukE
MRHGDLSSGAAQLEAAMETLRLAREEVAARWSDDASRAFAEEFLRPLEPRMKRMLDAIHRMAEALNSAQRECDADG